MKIILVILVDLLLFNALAAQSSVTVSGTIKDRLSKITLPYVNVVLKTEKDSSFVGGTITDEVGRFSLPKINSGNYFLEVSYIGYTMERQAVFVGSLVQYQSG